MTSGHVVGIGGARRLQSPNSFGDINIKELTRQAEKIGFSSELKVLVEDVGKIHDELKRKNLELSLLEIIAMESIDENVSDLRQQLFATVRLIHGDEIEEILKDENQVRRLANFDIDKLLPEEKSRNINSKEEMRNGIISRFRKHFHDYRQLRVEVKNLKKNWKYRNDVASSDSEDCCDSSG